MTDRAKLSSYLGDPSLLLAIPATGIYYAIVFLPSMKGGVLYRYTTEHAVEYVIVGMFLWGMIDVFLKLASFPREWLALGRTWLPPRGAREPVTHAQALLAGVQAQPQRYLNSRIGRRLLQALGYVVENESADDYADHLKYLAGQDEEATYTRFSLIRFVVAVTPILGFLGTVVHFGTALSGLSFSDLDNELSHVVSEMGTAFNTTTVALGAAMTTMFASFLCERIEHGIVRRIDRLVERELLNRFLVNDAQLTPFLSVLKEANHEFHAAVERSLQKQVETWSAALQSLFEQFDRRQQAEQQRWEAMSSEMGERHRAYDEACDDRLRQLLAISDARQEKHMSQIQDVLRQASAFSGEVNALAKTLNAIARGEGRLVELQASLAENLRILHETHQIDGALHGLTAAIHLLTVRNGTVPYKDAA
ncbi:MAG: MotA/TolQ/ExbB proton channel family protein [Planctomycetaceae bacterium]|nr:MotA/TolQ/ExbB proton channel family protein [Planctomycetaceae bacterium]